MVLDQISEIIKFIKSSGTGFYTNSYSNLAEVSDKNFQYFYNDGALAVCFDDGPVKRLLYFCNDFSFLKDVFNLVPSGEYLVEKVERNGFEDKLDLCNLGLSKIKRLYYYSTNKISDLFSTNNPVLKYSGIEESNVLCVDSFYEIRDILYSIFDARISHLPDDELLEKKIALGEFVGVFKDGKIVSLLQRKIDNKSFYINQVVNLGPKACIHSLMIKELNSFIESGGKIVYSWIAEDNIASIKFHEKYGLVRGPKYVTVYSLIKSDSN